MKHWILLLYLGFSVVLRAQNTASVQEAMANYDYKTVIRLIDEESASPQLLIQKAKALKGLGRTAEALSTLQHIIIELPENQQALVEAAECCRQLSKFNEALGYYRKVMELNPEHIYAHLQYTRLLYNYQRYGDALRESIALARKDRFRHRIATDGGKHGRSRHAGRKYVLLSFHHQEISLRLSLGS